MTINTLRWVLLPLLGFLTACGGGGGGGNSGGDGSGDQARLESFNARYPTASSGPLDIVYECALTGSQLIYYLYLAPNGSALWQFEVDTGQQFQFVGSYTYSDSTVHLQISGPGINIDETSSESVKALGLVYAFGNTNIGCGAIGHGYDIASYTGRKHFKCATVSEGPASDVNNAVELGALNTPGAIFRQRDRYVSGAINPITLRGYGIYRQDGDNIYAYFGQSFDDVNVVNGTLENAGSTLRIVELGDAGNCTLN